MESKSDLSSDSDELEIEHKYEHKSSMDVQAGDAPPAKVVALRDGYNQVYMIQSSPNHIHQVLFRCGNWCYTGRVDLGDAEVGLGDLPVLIPALQKQQGSLQYLSEWTKMPLTSIFTKPLNTLYDAFDFIGAELASDRVDDALQKAASVFSWIDDDDAKNYFELQTDGYDCFNGFDIIASKSFVRGLTLIVIYYHRSFYIVLQDGSGDQPLLDVRFPDLTEHLQGMQIQTYEDKAGYNKLLLWQAVQGGKPKVQRALKVQCEDVSGQGYTQTFLIRKTHAGAENNLREVLFRFGNWCYNGHVDLGPRMELRDIPLIIPMLRRQQSALTFMCESTKMPTTSLFAEPMKHLAVIVPKIQQELLNAEQTLVDMAQQGRVDGFGDISSWIDDDSTECYFEMATENSIDLVDVEAIASKVYLNSIVLIIIYYNNTFYVVVQDGSNEQPLLDTRFPDVTCPGHGFQVATYRRGVDTFPELRRISLWRVGAVPFNEESRPESSMSEQRAQAKESSSDPIQSKKEAKPGLKLGKTARPHHIAPLKGGKLQSLGDSGSQVAPWDKTGRPLGSRK